ncbi:MAG: hypothetical protein KME47_09505 [Nodosilinea sp. WJT8-NPBG4]|jgi:hypothetical protein|nr:hypothetical protein [Nodosilinea sp. WJT8-NPBG4]
MFNKLDLQRANASGEFEAIPYTKAIKRKPKQGSCFYITPVTWHGAPVRMIDIEFKTLGHWQIVEAVEGLPAGYAMQTHSINAETWNLIHDKDKILSASFEWLDTAVEDLHLLRDKDPSFFCDIFIWEWRNDYLQWSLSFDNAWEACLEYADCVFNQAVKTAYPDMDSPGTKDVGNRVMPPSQKEFMSTIIAEMQKQLDLL